MADTARQPITLLTDLESASRYSDNPDSFESILDNDKALNTPLEPSGLYPLHHAVRLNCPKIFACLLEKGADPSLKSQYPSSEKQQNTKSTPHQFTPIGLARTLYLKNTNYQSASSSDSDSDQENLEKPPFSYFQKALNDALKNALPEKTFLQRKALLDGGAKPSNNTTSLVINSGDANNLQLLITHVANLNRPTSKTDLTPHFFKIADTPTMAHNAFMARGARHVLEICTFIEKRNDQNLSTANKETYLRSIKNHVAKNQVDINAHNSFGFQPMHLAAFWNDIEVVTYLISLNANENPKDQTLPSNKPDADKNSADENRSMNGATPQLQTYFNEISPGDTALHIAVRKGHYAIVFALLGHLKPIQAPQSSTNQMNDSKHRSDENSNLFSHLFNQNNQPRRANLNHKNSNQETVSDVARNTNNAAITALLESYRSCQKIRAVIGSKPQQTPDNEKANSPSKIKAIEELFDQLDTLLKKIPNIENYQVDLRDDDGIGPLHLATENHDAALIAVLSKKMQDDNKQARNKHGWSALHTLARASYNHDEKDQVKEATIALLQAMPQEAYNAKTPNNPNDNHGDLNGDCTALHIAIHSGNQTVIEALTANAFINTSGLNGIDLTSLESAVFLGKLEAVRSLLTDTLGNSLLPQEEPKRQQLLHFAVNAGSMVLRGHESAKGPQENYPKILNLLMEQGIKPTNTQDEDISPDPLLYTAIHNKHLNMAVTLLKNGAPCEKIYGLLWRKRPMAMLLAHCLKILLGIVLLPLMLFRVITIFRKSSYCKLAMGTCWRSAIFDGPLLRSIKKKKNTAKQQVPSISSSTFQTTISEQNNAHQQNNNSSSTFSEQTVYNTI